MSMVTGSVETIAVVNTSKQKIKSLSIETSLEIKLYVKLKTYKWILRYCVFRSVNLWSDLLRFLIIICYYLYSISFKTK